MKSSFWILELQAKLNNATCLRNEYIHYDMILYLFGSATWNDTPGDLDIAILYCDDKRKEAQAIRDKTIAFIQSEFKYRVDCVLLSYCEEQQARFIFEEEAVLICPL